MCHFIILHHIHLIHSNLVEIVMSIQGVLLYSLDFPLFPTFLLIGFPLAMFSISSLAKVPMALHLVDEPHQHYHYLAPRSQTYQCSPWEGTMSLFSRLYMVVASLELVKSSCILGTWFECLQVDRPKPISSSQFLIETCI